MAKPKVKNVFYILGLFLGLCTWAEFKAQLPRTSVTSGSSWHICKPDPVLSGQRPRKLETERTTREVRGLSDWHGFLEDLYDRSKDRLSFSRAAITCLASALHPLPSLQHTCQLLLLSQGSFPPKKLPLLGRSDSLPQHVQAVRWKRQRLCGSGEQEAQRSS